ncbi:MULTISPECIES: RsmB/NOP family class I SAM-dependent RNA methyltransferase [Aminobacterium]|jgi:16S rRNA (cytosine967-C5)-methyltransferase|uniref:RsmB/NOP family class I SAM-dependent RNA methyltransferase n=1 Tax=Aminobacterium TaxID=81466 RepID=UPI00257EBA8F|nr:MULTISPECIES: RsmB/NOP family class I SAM-dependent RNA methyltransferase [unclassified Aminobacterium]
MRGIEAALCVLEDVSKGKFASESLRHFSENMNNGDRILAASLIYATLRRQSLWRAVVGRFLRPSFESLSKKTRNALILGTAGLLELKHFIPRVLVNALVQEIKESGRPQEARIVNAVLRRVEENGRAFLETLERSSGIQEQSLLAGVPLWVAYQWKDVLGYNDTLKLFKLFRMRPYASLRVFPQGHVPIVVENLKKIGIRGWASPLLDYSIRTASSVFPLDIPGFKEGQVTVQSESSMLVANIVAQFWKEGPILDMCAGRGIKAGQLASLLPHATIEAWELSKGRYHAARREKERLSLGARVVFRQGDALQMTPQMLPNLVFLDAPCSGSGTWNRHPEGRWALSKEKLENLVFLQKKLLRKGVSLVAPGGFIVYSTCSLMKQENEQVVAEILAENEDLVEMSIPLGGRYIKKGRPWGTYIWPELPWLDGFFIAAILKRNREV